eukprot:scpid39458/ scgid22745/ 
MIPAMLSPLPTCHDHCSHHFEFNFGNVHDRGVEPLNDGSIQSVNLSQASAEDFGGRFVRCQRIQHADYPGAMVVEHLILETLQYSAKALRHLTFGHCSSRIASGVLLAAEQHEAHERCNDNRNANYYR